MTALVHEPAKRPPKLRPDIVVIPVERDDGVIIYYKNPLTNDLCKFDELQHEILQRIDGRNDAETIAAEVSSLFDDEVPADYVEQVIERGAVLKLFDDFD